MSAHERPADLHYGGHASTTKEVAFIHAEVYEKLQEGKIVVLLWEAINSITNIWLSPVAIIT